MVWTTGVNWEACAARGGQWNLHWPHPVCLRPGPVYCIQISGPFTASFSQMSSLLQTIEQLCVILKCWGFPPDIVSGLSRKTSKGLHMAASKLLKDHRSFPDKQMNTGIQFEDFVGGKQNRKKRKHMPLLLILRGDQISFSGLETNTGCPHWKGNPVGLPPTG